MKRIVIFILIPLSILMIGGSGLASAQTRNSSRYDSGRAVRKANKEQQKAQKKYAKAQRKAERKMLKTERKNTSYPTRKF